MEGITVGTSLLMLLSLGFRNPVIMVVLLQIRPIMEWLAKSYPVTLVTLSTIYRDQLPSGSEIAMAVFLLLEQRVNKLLVKIMDPILGHFLKAE